MLILTPGETPLSQLEMLYRQGLAARLAADCRPDVEAAQALVRAAAEGGAAVYGVNTVFGKLASVKIAAGDTATLQRNLILSHCCGVGAPLDRATTRLMMALKLLSLGRGASGVRWAVTQQIEAMLAAGVTPVVPGQGSVGASGDLAPLAHMTAVMIGAGEPGKEILHPVAITIFGGLVTATLLDTFLTPLLFHRFGRPALDRLRERQQELKTAEAY